MTKYQYKLMNQVSKTKVVGERRYQAPSVELLPMQAGDSICTSVITAEMNLYLVDDGEVVNLTW